jgi:hypothetical protein
LQAVGLPESRDVILPPGRVALRLRVDGGEERQYSQQQEKQNSRVHSAGDLRGYGLPGAVAGPGLKDTHMGIKYYMGSGRHPSPTCLKKP